MTGVSVGRVPIGPGREGATGRGLSVLSLHSNENGYMGTMIILELNQVPVDYGKNHDWTSHGWLFPPGSDQDVPYVYADDVVETRPGLSAPLEQVRFRMDQLGYSLAEARDLYNAELERWNRTYALRLPFERLLAAVASIDFAALTQQDQEDFEYELPVLLLRILEATDPQDDGFDDGEAGYSGIEDFVGERIPVHVLVRCLAERPDNLALPLTWAYQDLVESGWEDRSTLMEIDRTQSTLNLIRLYGRLQDQSGCCCRPSPRSRWHPARPHEELSTGSWARQMGSETGSAQAAIPFPADTTQSVWVRRYRPKCGTVNAIRPRSPE